MSRPMNGLFAGFIATVALSLLMLLKSAIGLLADLNAIAMLAKLANQYLGLPAAPAIGWVLHFLIGTVLWGLSFAGFNPAIPGDNQVLKGMQFSVVAWLLMMVIPLPLAGAGLFGMKIGIGAPIATLILHLIYGAVLGAAYRSPTVTKPASTPPGA